MPTSEEEIEKMKKQLKLKNQLFKEKIEKSADFSILDLREINCIDASYAGGDEGIEFFNSIVDHAYVLFF